MADSENQIIDTTWRALQLGKSSDSTYDGTDITEGTYSVVPRSGRPILLKDSVTVPNDGDKATVIIAHGDKGAKYGLGLLKLHARTKVGTALIGIIDGNN